MKRIQEKVKDIVEVRAHKSLRDFTADPAETLSAYFFTDGTADLMAKWLDRVVASSPAGGSALALAGYRGVGKSHFLAAFAAILSHPELRSRVADPHVSSAAHRLARKPYPVIYVRRGLRNSLIEELREAVEEKAQLAASSLPESLPQILGAAVQMEGELPPVVLIDTAFDRGARVARDDGQLLGEIGEAAKELGVLLAVALDDDIATADGSNLGISRSFSIDYLDQEHLYKVVNSHVFPKLHHAQPALAEIYSYFREMIPGFRWSEQRFASLYPLHPAILEVAPFVRLYVPDFALLGFSSAAAERILGRPANSLIGLDEVFDNVEKALRTIEDLQEAFTAYDHLNTEVVGKIPILRRLQAKLVLKGLLLLSLDGQGTTAQEIGAAMMIFDEENPDSALSVIDDLIHKFSEELPDEIEVTDSEGERRYGFRITGKDSLNRVLADEIGSVPDEAVETVLRRSLNDRFPDSTLSAGVADGGDDRMDSHLIWRGGVRRGRVSVMSDGSREPGPP